MTRRRQARTRQVDRDGLNRLLAYARPGEVIVVHGDSLGVIAT